MHLVNQARFSAQAETMGCKKWSKKEVRVNQSPPAPDREQRKLLTYCVLVLCP